MDTDLDVGIFWEKTTINQIPREQRTTSTTLMI
jgi:hypothetical protein